MLHFYSELKHSRAMTFLLEFSCLVHVYPPPYTLSPPQLISSSPTDAINKEPEKIQVSVISQLQRQVVKKKFYRKHKDELWLLNDCEIKEIKGFIFSLLHLNRELKIQYRSQEILLVLLPSHPLKTSPTHTHVRVHLPQRKATL